MVRCRLGVTLGHLNGSLCVARHTRRGSGHHVLMRTRIILERSGNLLAVLTRGLAVIRYRERKERRAMILVTSCSDGYFYVS